MSQGQWDRWMSLLERGEAMDKPAHHVNAYVINDDPAWDEAERRARIATLKRFLKTQPHEGHWVIFEHADGRHEVVWPGD
jgi:hypothetical protein